MYTQVPEDLFPVSKKPYGAGAVRFKAKPTKAMQGTALLTALFIMTLVAIVATAMSKQLQLDVYRTELLVRQDKLYLASEKVGFWALSELSTKQHKFTWANAEGIVSYYPKHFANSISIEGTIYDLQARFNLNNLINKRFISSFIGLINHAIPQASKSQKVQWALAVNDWLSPYDRQRGKDAYLTYYLSQKPAYYPSHQLMSSRSELRLVKGFDTSTYLALEPFMNALPEPTAININTASPMVLMSLSNRMNAVAVNELIRARADHGIQDKETLSQLLEKFAIAPDQITLNSTYFLNVAYIKDQDLSLIVCRLFKRTVNKQGKLSVQLLRESFNSF